MSDRGQILVVEDEQVQRMILQAQLKSMGYEATSVADGEEALELLARRRFDAVLMDCQMPRLDGYETTRILRRREAAGEHTVVIAVTATQSAEVARRCEAAGMDAFTVKPVRRVALETLFYTSPAPRATEAHQAHPTSGAANVENAMLRSFLEESLRDFREMREAMRSKDPQKLATAAHALAGNSSVFDLLQLAEDCRELETLADRGDLASCERLVPRLEQSFEQISRCFTASRNPANIEVCSTLQRNTVPNLAPDGHRRE